MDREEFVGKWNPRFVRASQGYEVDPDFISDLNSLLSSSREEARRETIEEGANVAKSHGEPLPSDDLDYGWNRACRCIESAIRSLTPSPAPSTGGGLCRNCFGEGNLAEDPGDGEVELVTCPICHGTGKETTESTCQGCNGSGVVDDECGGIAACGDCFGAGRAKETP